MDNDEKNDLLTKHLPTNDVISIASDYLVISDYSKITNPTEMPMEGIISKVSDYLLKSSCAMVEPVNAKLMRFLFSILHGVSPDSASSLFNFLYKDDISMLSFIRDGFGEELIFSLNEIKGYYPRDKLSLLANLLDESYKEVLYREMT